MVPFPVGLFVYTEAEWERLGPIHPSRGCWPARWYGCWTGWRSPRASVRRAQYPPAWYRWVFDTVPAPEARGQEMESAAIPGCSVLPSSYLRPFTAPYSSYQTTSPMDLPITLEAMIPTAIPIGYQSSSGRKMRAIPA